MFNALDEEVRQPEISVDRRVLLHDKTADIVLHKTQAGVIEQTRELLPIRSNLALMGVPSLQCWGWGESASWDLDTMRREIEFNNDVHNMASFENVGKNVYRVVAQDLEGTRRGFTGQYVTDWDMQRNVPIKFVAHHASPSKYEPAETTSVKWRSIDDFFIPESARTSRRSMETIAGLRFHLREEISFEVHWFSFNSELSKELFSEELLRDRRKLDELLNTDVFEDNSKPPQIREGN
jgi:hypothetical protein